MKLKKDSKKEEKEKVEKRSCECKEEKEGECNQNCTCQEEEKAEMIENLNNKISSWHYIDNMV